jgi:tRNA(Phe) wybutosine-synthesizing methylase Tyw3
VLKDDPLQEALLEALGCGSDRSKKGSFDEPIDNMLSHLNLHPEYMSTSSCSGRIVLFRESKAEGKAKGGEWILCKHGEVFKEELAEAIKRVEGSEGLIVFRHEPFILHVQVSARCRDNKFHACLQTCGPKLHERDPGKSMAKVLVIHAPTEWT